MNIPKLLREPLLIDAACDIYKEEYERLHRFNIYDGEACRKAAIKKVLECIAFGIAMTELHHD